MSAVTAHASQHAEKAKEPSNWLKVLAKSGYAARGVVYLVIGGLALFAAFSGERAEGSKGAIQEMLGGPFGTVLVVLVAVGMLGYAAWRAVQAVLDADDHGTDSKGVVVRTGLGISAITHTLLAVYAFGLLTGGSSGSGGGGSGSQQAVATLMQQPFGQWLVGFVGLCVVGAGVAQIVKGFKEGYRKYLQLSDQQWQWANPVCKVGLIARGITFLIMGGFVLWAAYTANSSETRGLAGALQTVKDQPFGPWLLATVAVGLLAFACYSLLEAYSRRIDAPDAMD